MGCNVSSSVTIALVSIRVVATCNTVCVPAFALLRIRSSLSVSKIHLRLNNNTF